MTAELDQGRRELREEKVNLCKQLKEVKDEDLPGRLGEERGRQFDKRREKVNTTNANRRSLNEMHEDAKRKSARVQEELLKTREDRERALADVRQELRQRKKQYDDSERSAACLSKTRQAEVSRPPSTVHRPPSIGRSSGPQYL